MPSKKKEPAAVAADAPVTEEKKAERQPVSKEDLQKAEAIFDQMRTLADTLPKGVESIISIGRYTQSNASGLYLLMISHRMLDNVFNMNKDHDQHMAMLTGLLASGALQLLTHDGLMALAKYYGADGKDMKNDSKQAKIAHVERLLRGDTGSAAA